jgi:hypothetical protein
MVINDNSQIEASLRGLFAGRPVAIRLLLCGIRGGANHGSMIATPTLGIMQHDRYRSLLLMVRGMSPPAVPARAAASNADHRRQLDRHHIVAEQRRLVDAGGPRIRRV